MVAMGKSIAESKLLTIEPEGMRSAEVQHAESSRGNPDLSRPIHGRIGWFGGIRRIHAPHESGHFFRRVFDGTAVARSAQK